MTLVATFVPFTYLDDGISVGILIAFNMTNSSLILMKCNHDNGWLARYLTLYHVLAFGAALIPRTLEGTTPMIASILATLALAIFIHFKSTKQEYFGAHLKDNGGSPPLSSSNETFETPMVPFIPLLGIAMNWYLIAQLEWTGLLMLFLYLGAVSLLYQTCCSKLTLPWGYDSLDDQVEVDGPILLRELSLPKR